MNSKYPILALVLTTWHFAKGHRHLLIYALCMFAVAQAFSLAEPYIIGKFLNTVQADFGSEDFLSSVLYYLGLYIAIQIGFWTFHGPGRVIERHLAFHVRTNFRNKFFRIVTELPVRWHKDTQSGDTIDKINRAAGSLYEFSGQNFELVYMLGRLFGSIIILLFFLPEAGIVALLVALFAFGAIHFFDKLLYGFYRQSNKLENRVAAGIHDYITNIVTVITLRLETKVHGEVMKRIFAPFSILKRSFVFNEAKWFVVNMIIALMITAILYWFIRGELASGNELMAGTLFTLFEYLRRIGDSFYNFAWKYGTIVQHAANVNNARPILESYSRYPAKSSPIKLKSNWNELAIRNLNFTYEDEQHRTHHLKNISIDLSRNSKIALVGESGSGKSTFLSLLRGLHQPGRAEVFCDKEPVAEGLSALAHHTTLLPQEPEIFADTIRFNITFGVAVDETELISAVKLARFDPVLSRLPRGLETNIAEKGVNLSGGEKQRLALARGIFFAAESDILLLDESTSSVDVKNELMIFRSLLSHFKDKCIISAIHKLHLLEMFDYVYVFDDGKIIEHGSFESLILKNGKLSALWKEYQRKEAQIVF